MKTASNTHFKYEEQILLNDNYWKLNEIFEKGIVELEEIKILEKQENDSSAVYLIYINFFSNSILTFKVRVELTQRTKN